MTAGILRPGLPPVPKYMAGLPIDARGYPVPAFVEWINGVPDFRIMRFDHLVNCVQFDKCWLCGEKLGKLRSYVIGPMCAVNRNSAEPPSHHDCAVFAAKACPFLTRPKAVRRDLGPAMQLEVVEPAGEMIKRNPGVALVWTTRGPTHYEREPRGFLFDVGEPVHVEWFAEGRDATRAEVLASMDSGAPILVAKAKEEGPESLQLLAQMITKALTYLPIDPPATTV